MTHRGTHICQTPHTPTHTHTHQTHQIFSIRQILKLIVLAPTSGKLAADDQTNRRMELACSNSERQAAINHFPWPLLLCRRIPWQEQKQEQEQEQQLSSFPFPPDFAPFLEPGRHECLAQTSSETSPSCYTQKKKIFSLCKMYFLTIVI